MTLYQSALYASLILIIVLRFHLIIIKVSSSSGMSVWHTTYKMDKKMNTDFEEDKITDERVLNFAVMSRSGKV